MKKEIIMLCGAAMILLSACVNDPEKHTESEVDPDLKDTAARYEKVGPKDATDGDTTSKVDTSKSRGRESQPKKQ